MQTHPAFICKLGNISYFEAQINVPTPQKRHRLGFLCKQYRFNPPSLDPQWCYSLRGDQNLALLRALTKIDAYLWWRESQKLKASLGPSAATMDPKEEPLFGLKDKWVLHQGHQGTEKQGGFLWSLGFGIWMFGLPSMPLGRLYAFGKIIWPLRDSVSSLIKIIPSFMQKIFIEHSPYVWHCSKPWGYSREQCKVPALVAFIL